MLCSYVHVKGGGDVWKLYECHQVSIDEILNEGFDTLTAEFDLLNAYCTSIGN